MPQRNSKDVIAGPTTGRAEVMAAIDGLAKEVAQLAFNVKRVTKTGAQRHTPTAFPQPKNTSRREENAIAARVAELSDRVGGFIKPPPPKLPE
jgi:hypothetical protein